MRLSLAPRLLLFLSIARGSPAQSPELPPRFALEVQTGEGTKPTYAVVSRTPDDPQPRTVFFLHTLLPLPQNVPAAKGKPSALGLEYKEDGDAVSVVASLYFDYSTAKIDDLSKRPHQQIGSYSLHLEESVLLEEMKSFGVQPVTVKVVSARAPRSDIQATSKIPGLQIAVTGEDRVVYKLEVRNLSSQPVIGLMIEWSSPNGQKNGSAAYDDRKPLILSGGSYKIPMNKNDVGCNPPENPTLDPVPCPIVLNGAVFADGTHVGDTASLASMEAYGAATSEPRRQLQRLMQAIMDDPDLSDTEKLARLRSEIPKLVEPTVAPVIDQLRPGYPELRDEDWLRIGNSMNRSLHQEKEMILHDLAKYEEASRSGEDTESLTRWMRRWGLIN